MKVERKGKTAKERLEQNRRGYVTQTPGMRGAGYADVYKGVPGKEKVEGMPTEFTKMMRQQRRVGSRRRK